MTPPRFTAMLAAILVGLLALDGVAHRPLPEEPPLPAIPKRAASEITAITLHHGDEEVRLDRTDAGWTLAEPFAFPADAERVTDLLALADGVPMDARIDTGNHDKYGLDGADPIRVTFLGEAGELSSFYVGNNAEGGSTFVRFPGSDDVYRARVGGRSRFERRPGEWRDRTLYAVDAATVSRVALTGPDGPLTLERTGSGWSLAEDPGFPLDPVLADSVAQALAHLVGLEVLAADHPAGLDAPAGSVAVTTTAGELPGLTLGRAAGEAYARRADRPEVYRLPPPLVDALLAPRAVWADRTLVREDLATLSELAWSEGGNDTVLRREGGGVWQVVRPANVAVDPKSVAQVARWLAALRTDGWAPVTAVEAGFPSGVTLGWRAGDSAGALEIGALVPGRAAGAEALYVRTAARPERIGVLPARAVAGVRSVFSR